MPPCLILFIDMKEKSTISLWKHLIAMTILINGNSWDIASPFSHLNYCFIDFNFYLSRIVFKIPKVGHEETLGHQNFIGLLVRHIDSAVHFKVDQFTLPPLRTELLDLNVLLIFEIYDRCHRVFFEYAQEFLKYLKFTYVLFSREPFYVYQFTHLEWFFFVKIYFHFKKIINKTKQAHEVFKGN